MRSRRSQRKARIRVYDFTRPDKFSKDNQKSLGLLCDNVARFMGTSLSGYLRTMVQVTLLSVEQMTYGEFTDALRNPLILGIASLEPLEGKIAVELDERIAFPMLERLFGNSGQTAVYHRALTDIEVVVMETISRRILNSVREALEAVHAVEPALDSIETTPFFTHLAPPTEMVILVRFEVKFRGDSGHVNICLPFTTLEPVLPRLSLHRWIGRATNQGSVSSESVAMEQHVDSVDVAVSVQVGSTDITIAELLEIEPGDVIKLDQPVERPLPVLVEGEPVHLGYPGRRGKRMAVCICTGGDAGQVRGDNGEQ